MNVQEYISKQFRIPQAIVKYVFDCEREVQHLFQGYEETAQINQFKVLHAFSECEIANRHFNPTTGYGYGDEGREKLCAVFAHVFGAEDAIVSPHIMSGTHALALALFGVLRGGDFVLCATGKPYDTLFGTIQGAHGSLRDAGVEFESVPLTAAGGMDEDAIFSVLQKKPQIRMLYLQRSTGYDVRSAFTIAQLEAVITRARSLRPELLIMVDNCYGEFVDTREPLEIGADLIAGSLIKNPGGGLAPTGGYVAGKQALVERIAGRFSAPGIGMEIGSYAASYQPFFQGLFLAPHIVMQALKGVTLAAKVFDSLGFETRPKFDAARGDITQSLIFKDEGLLVNFVRGIQRASAIDSNVVPYPWDMPGYQNQVIMAAGTFVQGASVELTADAPIRAPYVAYLQGALTYEHAKFGVMCALKQMNLRF